VQNKEFEYERKKVEIHKAYSKTIDPDLFNNLPRVEDLDSINPMDRDKRLMNIKLPVYFHNMGTRISVDHHHSKTLRNIHISKTDYVSPSSINTGREEFRVDPMTGRKVGAPRSTKNTVTFQ